MKLSAIILFLAATVAATPNAAWAAPGKLAKGSCLDSLGRKIACPVHPVHEVGSVGLPDYDDDQWLSGGSGALLVVGGGTAAALALSNRGGGGGNGFLFPVSP
jgi:hypothetical protein